MNDQSARTGRLRWAASAASGLALATSLSAQTPPPPAPVDAGEPIRLEEVVALGTRFGDRTAIESPVPIDLISGNELRRSGLTEVNQVLQRLVPSFNFPRPTVADGTDHTRPATLRGLAPDQVLVLVNGKRRHTSALINVNGTVGRGSGMVDLNALPTSAIGRIEVLRDGAAAQYGSDAIAGVINIVLRDDLEGDLTSTVGVTEEGDGTVYNFSVGKGFPIFNNGTIFVSAYYRDREETNRSLADTRQQYFGTNIATGALTAISGNFGSGLTAPSGTRLDPRESQINRINHRQGDSATVDRGLFYNAEVPLNDQMEFYSFGGFNLREGESAGFFRRAGDNRTVRAIHPNGFLPLIATQVDDGSFGAGVRGEAAGWNYDASTVYGGNRFEFNVKNSNNASLGAASPTQFFVGVLDFEQWTTNLDLRRGFDIGRDEPLNLAGGVELRYEGYKITPGEPDSWRDGGVPVLDGPARGSRSDVGAQVFPGFRPSDAQDADRTSFAAYFEAEHQVLDPLLLSAAVRYENFSDFGDTFDGKVAGRLELIKGLAGRASISTGFRAPSLGQQYFSSTATNFIGGVPFEIRTFPVENAIARELGASPLDPEKSVNVSVGATAAPIDGFTASVDWYFIQIDDRIVLSSNFTGTAVGNFLASRGFAGVNGGRYFTNAVDTETQGIDINFRYSFDLDDIGRFEFTGGYNRNWIKVTSIKGTPPQLAAIGVTTPLFDLTERIRLEKGQPEDVINLHFNYRRDKLSVDLRGTRYGAVETVAATSWSAAQIAALTPGYTVRFAPTVPPSANAQVIQEFGSLWVYDWELSYDLFDNLTVAIGMNNAADEYPDENIRSTAQFAGSDNVGIFPYSGNVPSGFNGRFSYARATFRF